MFQGGLSNVIFLTSFYLLLLLVSSEPQFRSEQNREHYEDPYRRRYTTSRPQQRDPNDPYDPGYNRENIRYRGFEYRVNQRGGPGYGTRERDRLRLNYNQQNPKYQDFELKNTIFDRWRPDLQGEQRPGETPGINLPLAEDVFVSTDTGRLQGFYVYLYDRPGNRPDEWPVNKPLELQRHFLNVTVFLGVPYAQPPIIEGRFKPPRRVHNWHTTWQAIDYSPACPQNLKYVGATKGIRSGIDEDCLYLNVFTPSLSVNARERYPVMFYIHGGDFDHGSGSQFPAHMLSAWGEVVVVTINYRMGALGFLSTGDYHSPGNYGLQDMALALEWVNTNIRFFNGDKDRISLFGPGAGGAAAGLLAVIPKTRDWVSQVIAESGSPLADWAALDDPYRVQNTSRVFGLEMGCNVDNSYNLMHCLVNRDYEELATVYITPDVGTFAWSPVVDGNFTVPEDDWYEDWSEEDFHILPDLPINLYSKNLHHPNLRYLTGSNRDEAADFIFNDARLSTTNYIVTEDFFNERIKEWVRHYNYTLNPDGAFDAIKWMYTFWPDPHNTTHIREQYIHMLSDALYKSGVDQIVKLLTNSTGKRSVPTYYYLLNTTVEALNLPLWREVPNNLEYYFVSGAPFMDPDFYPESIRVSRQLWTEGDRNISRFMMKAWANFAWWGNPTQEQVKPIEVNWEPTVEGALKYLSINTTFNSSMHYNYRQPQNTFWYEYMPLVVHEYIPTPPPPRNPWVDMKEPVTATMYGLLAVVIAFLVVLCVCCGMWKSAKRQRNKALDDLSYYSTENLSVIQKENEDFVVRKYLENSSSRSNTMNTAASTGTNNSRPITPCPETVSNGRIPTNGHEHSQPDNLIQYESQQSLPRHYAASSTASAKANAAFLAAQAQQQLQQRSISVDNARVMNIGPNTVPSVLSGNQNVNMGNFQLSTSERWGRDQQLGIPELAPYTEITAAQSQPLYSTLNSRKGDTFNMQPQSQSTMRPEPAQRTQFTYTVQHQPPQGNPAMNPNQSQPNVQYYTQQSFPQDNFSRAEPTQRTQFAYNVQHQDSQSDPLGATQHVQPIFQYPAQQPAIQHENVTPAGVVQLEPEHERTGSNSTHESVPASEHSTTALIAGNGGGSHSRPVTPSSVTFGISLKPSKSSGTGSGAGLILNTDL